MRIAFVLQDRGQWTGGANYLVNLVSAIAELPGRPIEPLLFLRGGVEDSLVERFRPHLSEPPSALPVGKLTRAQALLTQCDRGAVETFRNRQADIVFQGANWYGARFPLRTLAWMPDFQHRHLPGMFGAGAWARRELGYRLIVRFASWIMLSSEDARRDCESFYPRARGRTSVVPFAVNPPEAASVDEIEALRKRLGLPEKFFFLPNQFWKHKNHGVVLKALSLLKAEGRSVTVAVTGNPRDARHPEYPRQLLGQVETLGLASEFRVLGLLPFREVQLLLRRCTALMNPSFFEGWSTTVEEAKALGVPVILSDIAVHREQKPAQAFFFDPKDEHALARLLWEAWTQLPQSWQDPPGASLQDLNRARRKSFAESFAGAARLAFEGKG